MAFDQEDVSLIGTGQDFTTLAAWRTYFNNTSNIDTPRTKVTGILNVSGAHTMPSGTWSITNTNISELELRPADSLHHKGDIGIASTTPRAFINGDGLRWVISVPNTLDEDFVLRLRGFIFTKFLHNAPSGPGGLMQINTASPTDGERYFELKEIGFEYGAGAALNVVPFLEIVESGYPLHNGSDGTFLVENCVFYLHSIQTSDKGFANGMMIAAYLSGDSASYIRNCTMEKLYDRRLADVPTSVSALLAACVIDDAVAVQNCAFYDCRGATPPTGGGGPAGAGELGKLSTLQPFDGVSHFLHEDSGNNATDKTLNDNQFGPDHLDGLGLGDFGWSNRPNDYYIDSTSVLRDAGGEHGAPIDIKQNPRPMSASGSSFPGSSDIGYHEFEGSVIQDSVELPITVPAVLPEVTALPTPIDMPLSVPNVLAEIAALPTPVVLTLAAPSVLPEVIALTTPTALALGIPAQQLTERLPGTGVNHCVTERVGQDAEIVAVSREVTVVDVSHEATVVPSSHEVIDDSVGVTCD